MSLNEEEIVKTLLDWRIRISASVWVVVRDHHLAEDIFQNITLKAMTKGNVFETRAALVSWAFISARREGIDWLRKNKRQARILDESVYEKLDRDWAATHPSQSVGGRVDAMLACFEALPDHSKKLLRLRYYEGLSCQEIALKMQTELTAIYKRLSRLHMGLKSCIENKHNIASSGA